MGLPRQTQVGDVHPHGYEQDNFLWYWEDEKVAAFCRVFFYRYWTGLANRIFVRFDGIEQWPGSKSKIELKYAAELPKNSINLAPNQTECWIWLANDITLTAKSQKSKRLNSEIFCSCVRPRCATVFRQVDTMSQTFDDYPKSDKDKWRPHFNWAGGELFPVVYQTTLHENWSTQGWLQTLYTCRWLLKVYLAEASRIRHGNLRRWDKGSSYKWTT